LRLFSFGGYGSALAALALVVFGAYDSYPCSATAASRHIKTTGMRNTGHQTNDVDIFTAQMI